MKTSEIKLGVNIDHCATLREARYRNNHNINAKIIEPNLVEMALAAEEAGSDGITIHLREDRRHIQVDDVWQIRESIQTRLNLEMAPTDEMIEFAKNIKPAFVCLVPENRQEITTEGGLDIVSHKERIRTVISEMKTAGIKTSLFIDPHPQQIEMAAELQSPFIELHTGSFANAYYDSDLKYKELEKLCNAAKIAHEFGIVVNAGHGINYTNISEVKNIPWLYELNIGHSIVSRSLSVGMHAAVTEMKKLIKG